MKKILLTTILLCTVAITFAQEANFAVKGMKLPKQTKNGTVVKLFDRQTWDSIGCAIVNKGEFVITGHTDSVFMGWVTDSRYLYCPVVVEPNMSITLNARYFTISGSPLNDQLNRYFKGYLRYEKLRNDSYDITGAVKEGGWIHRKAEQAITLCTDTINHFNNTTGWQIYNDNHDNVVGAWMLFHYMKLFTGDGDYNSDTVILRQHFLDSVYAAGSPVVRRFLPLRKEYERSQHQREVSRGKRFTDFSGISMTTQKMVQLSDLVSRHVAIVDFWASWCGPCRREITDYIKPLYERYADRGLVVVGVGVWDKIENFGKAISELGIPYPQIIDTTKTVSTLYGFNSIPQVFLVNSDGIMIGNFRGNDLVNEVEKALGIRNKEQ